MKPSPTKLRYLFDYAPLTGELRWKNPTGHRRGKGDIAGCRTPDGRMLVGIHGRLYKVHRVIWAMVTGRWPPHQIDHKNEDGLDNRWANLRRATKAQNMRNITITRANTSGYKGVSWQKTAKRWRAYIKVDRKYIHLGHFKQIEDARDAYRQACHEHHGEFAKHN